MLNEDNFQQTQLYNVDENKQTIKLITGSFRLDDDRVVQTETSETLIVSLDYTVDGSRDSYIFRTEGITLSIRIAASLSSVSPVRTNEVVIVSNNPYSRAFVYLHKAHRDKLFYYEYGTANSVFTVGNMNEVAKKLNGFDPVANERRVDDLEAQVNLLDNDLTVLENNLTALDTKLTATENTLTDLTVRVSMIETAIEVLPTLTADVSELKNKTSDLETKTAGLSRADTTTTITDSLKLDSTFEVVGKSTVADLEVKSTLTVAGDSTVAKLTATEINTATVKNGNYKALFFREGTVANFQSLSKMSIEVRVSGTNKKIILKGTHYEQDSHSLNNNEYYLKEIELPFMFDSIARVVFRQSIDAIFNLGSDAGTTNNKVKLGYRNVSGGSQNIGGKTRNFVVEGICNNIDDIPGITWIV